jgi:hypothetical protein
MTDPDAPWEEARGPHLPDPLVDVARRVPVVGWLFIVLAIATLAWELRGRVASFAELDPIGALTLAVFVVPPVATCLFGAALFVRHPRASSTDPRIVFGIVLLVLVEAVDVVRFVVIELMRSSSQDSELFPPVVVSIGFAVAGGLLRAFGLVYIARGLLDARAFEDDGGARRRLILISALAVFGVVALASAFAIAFDKDLIDLDLNGGLAGIVAVLATEVLGLVAIAYVTATVPTGATSGARPTRAWRAGAVGAWLLLLSAVGRYLANTAVWLTFSPESGNAPDIYFRLTEALGYATSAGYVFLLAAFALGLPGVDELEPAVGEDVQDSEVTSDIVDASVDGT